MSSILIFNDNATAQWAKRLGLESKPLTVDQADSVDPETGLAIESQQLKLDIAPDTVLAGSDGLYLLDATTLGGEVGLSALARAMSEQDKVAVALLPADDPKVEELDVALVAERENIKTLMKDMIVSNEGYWLEGEYQLREWLAYHEIGP